MSSSYVNYFATCHVYGVIVTFVIRNLMHRLMSVLYDPPGGFKFEAGVRARSPKA